MNTVPAEAAALAGRSQSPLRAAERSPLSLRRDAQAECRARKRRVMGAR